MHLLAVHSTLLAFAAHALLGCAWRCAAICDECWHAASGDAIGALHEPGQPHSHHGPCDCHLESHSDCSYLVPERAPLDDRDYAPAYADSAAGACHAAAERARGAAGHFWIPRAPDAALPLRAHLMLRVLLI